MQAGVQVWCDCCWSHRCWEVGVLWGGSKGLEGLHGRKSPFLLPPSPVLLGNKDHCNDWKFKILGLNICFVESSLHFTPGETEACLPDMTCYGVAEPLLECLLLKLPRMPALPSKSRETQTGATACYSHSAPERQF